MTHGESCSILVVEDDPNIRALIETYLASAGFQTVSAADGRTALELAQDRPVDFVILDLLLPEMDGWEVARELRRISDVPILILTAQKDEIDRVAGFKVGADDYVVKPFSPRELVERVKAIRRRSLAAAGAPKASRVLRRGGLELDPARHVVTRDGERLALTRFEFRLLEILMQAPGHVFSRQLLIERIYEQETAVVDRVVDVHVGKLRQKIERDPAAPRLVCTVRGVGYCFSEDP
ncbi:MAG: response regulator transcription factor [Pararhodobacter sp.]|nr:response regulator transcription factor [Pararhodobacter sp.]